MELNRNSKLLRIFIGSTDHIKHQPLYEAIVFAARKNGLAGATVIKGTMSYGASALVHTTKVFEVSTDMPVIIEIIDHESRINDFVGIVSDMMEMANCGGLVTLEEVEVLYYKSKKKD